MNSIPKIIVFDLDGTLAVSKQRLDQDMVELLGTLLAKTKVAITSGGKWEQFLKQVIEPLQKFESGFENLFIFPTCGGAFYRFTNGKWNAVYAYPFTPDQKKKILEAFQVAFKETNFEQPKKTYGEQIEDRDTQITYSILGQEAPFSEKSKWDPDATKRKTLFPVLQRLLPEFGIAFGGTTSIDINKKGIDKAYALKQIEKYLDIKISDMLYVGDRLMPGGNDHVVVGTGIKTKAVVDQEETKIFLKKLIAN